MKRINIMISIRGERLVMTCLAVVAITLCLLCTTANADVITHPGDQIDLGSGWRTSTVAKPLDIDGNNVLGTDGYQMVNKAAVLPSYVSSMGILSGTYGGNASYASIDDPLLVPPNGGGLFVTGTMNPAPGLGNPADLYSFTFNSLASSRTVRVGLMVDNLDGAGFNADSLELVQTAGGVATSGVIPTTSLSFNNRTPDWLFFDISGIKNGDAFKVVGVGGSSTTATLGGIAFDSVVPEPSTLMLFGLGGLLVWWRRRAVRATLSVVAVAALCAGSSQAATLILDLRADQGVTTSGANVTSWADQSGMGNTVTQGTVANQPLLVSSTLNGITKPAIEFNSLKKLVGASTSAFDFGTGDFTMIAVVNLFTQNGGGDRILGNLQNGGSFPGFMLDAGLTAGKVAGVYRNDSSGAQTTITDPTAFPVSSAVTVFGSERTGGTTLNFYRNGTVVNTGVLGAAVAINGDAITIGAERTGGGEFFAGQLYEVRIYSGTFSPGELAAIQTSLLQTWTQVPEPSTIALFAVGGLALAWWRRQRRAL